MIERAKRSLAAALALVATAGTGSRIAHAEPSPTAVCIDAHEKAQRSMQEGKLRAARESLLVCSRETCPKVAQTDCASWLRDVARDTPSVVLAAKDVAGQDREDVRVVIDGDQVVAALDGRALPLDPGPHVFRFESGGRRVEQKAVLGVGEQNRRVVADFATTEHASVAPFALGLSPTIAPEPSRTTGLPVATYALGGVAVLALGSFTVFALTGKNQEGCVPTCTSAEVSYFRRSYLVADISLIVALASAGGAVLFATTKR